jgi:hypothetical protein
MSVATINGLSSLKFLSGLTTGVGIQAGISKVITGLTPQFTAGLSLIQSTVGTLASGNSFNFDIAGSLVKSTVAFASNGLFVNNLGTFTKILDNPLVNNLSQLSNYQFSINQLIPSASTMSVYLEGALKASNIPCVSSLGSYVNGTIDLVQKGQTAVNQITNLTNISVLKGLL